MWPFAALQQRQTNEVTRLLRIAALTGATRTGNCFVLTVGKTQFEVRCRYVKRLRDMTDPKCIHEETCFYSPGRAMSNAEQVGSVLLQLTNNPALFDKWAAQHGRSFKPDGQVFANEK